MSQKLLEALAPILLSALTAGATWALAHLALWLKAKAEGNRAFNALAQVEDLVASVVQDVENTTKPLLASALADGELTTAEGVQLKTAAMDAVKKRLGADGLATLKKVLGAVIGGDLDGWLSGKIEQAVSKLSPKPA